MSDYGKTLLLRGRVNTSYVDVVGSAQLDNALCIIIQDIIDKKTLILIDD